MVLCLSQMPGADVEQAWRAWRQGRCDLCQYLCNSLAGQIGGYLGEMDARVKAVYRFQPEDVRSGKTEAVDQTPNIHLVVWVEHKSAALEALVASLSSWLADSLRNQLGCARASPACYHIDVHIVDDDEVDSRRGMGVLVNSARVRSERVWARSI